MGKSDEIWDALGDLPAEEAMHVVTKLFFMYEEELSRQPESSEAITFFKRLSAAISQTCQCNLNRR